MRLSLLLVLVAACGGNKDDKPKVKEEPHEVAFAREEMPELDKRLASNDPESASSVCAVLKPDLVKIRAADAELGKTIDTRCGHDLALRAFAAKVDKIEAARKAQPTGSLFECAGRMSYDSMLYSGHAEAEPEVKGLRTRWDAACTK